MMSMGKATRSDELPVAQLVAEVERIREAAGSGATRPVLERALARLEESIAALEVAAEELEVRNEELRLALLDVDVQRRRYRDLFDMAADGYLVTDARDVVVEANRAAGALMARPAESLLGRRIADLVVGGRGEFARRLRHGRLGAEGDEIVEVERAGRGALAHVRYRRRADERAGEPQIHWTLTDLDGPIFEAESADDEGAGSARRWLGIYGELIAVAEDLLADLQSRADTMSRTARIHLMDREVRPLEAHLARLRARRDHWSSRHAAGVGLELDPQSVVVRYGVRMVQMTRRERQLLRFLIDRPGSFFPSRVLLARAWHASYLSEEQVRTYVGRLRRKLAELELPCELVTQRPQGYALVFAEGDGDAPSPSPV
jgi:PAS domain S-box-containing protein